MSSIAITAHNACRSDLVPNANETTHKSCDLSVQNQLAIAFFNLSNIKEKFTVAELCSYSFTYLHPFDLLSITTTCWALGSFRNGYLDWSSLIRKKIKRKSLAEVVHWTPGSNQALLLQCPVEIDCGHSPVSCRVFLRELMHHRQLPSQVSSLTIKVDCHGKEEWNLLLDSLENLRRLKPIITGFAHTNVEALGALLQSNIRNIEELDLSGNQLDLNGALMIQKYGLGQINVLNLQKNELGSSGMHFLALAEIRNLREIDLSNNNIERADDFFSADLRSLRVLKLDCNRLREVPNLEEARMAHLEELYMRDNDLGAGAVTSIVNATFFQNLKVLDLSSNCIGKEGIETLCSKGLNHLVQLMLFAVGIDDDDLKLLMKAHLNSLQVLDLSRNLFGHEGVTALAAADLSSLRELHLARTPIDDLCMKTLLKANLVSLRILNLNDCQIGDEGAKALAEADLPNIKKINVGDNLMYREGILALAAAPFKKRCLILVTIW